MQHYFSHNSYCVPNVIAISWKMKVPQAYKPVTSHRNKTITFQRWAQDLFSIALNYCNIKSFIVLLQSRTLVTLYCRIVFDVNYDNLIGNCIRFLRLNDYQEYIKLYFMWLDFNQLWFVACHSHVCFKGELP